MAKKLKDYYDFDYIRDLSNKFAEVEPSFNSESYNKEIPANYNDLTFLKRQDAIVNALEVGLKGTFTENLNLFRLIWGEELKQETGMFTEGWWLWPLGRYVEKHGVEDTDATLVFVYEFTKRHTGEYIVRPLLINNTRYLMETFLKWSQDGNVHVRRLSTEGMRISLPWAVKTVAALTEPIIYEQILTNLKDDSSKFIQKSVGNNINDLYKVDPEFAERIIDTWNEASPSKNTTWIINHGRRNQKTL